MPCGACSACGWQRENDRVSSDHIATMDSGAEFPRAGYAWYVVLILFLTYVVSFLDRQILTLLVEPIKADLEISDTMVSLLHGFTFAIFYTLFGLPLGRMADHHNRTRMIMGGVALWSAMTAACGFARNALMLFGARVGVAVGEATLSPSAYSIISDYFPRGKRGRAISLYSLGIFVGAGMAYIFGGLVAEFATQSVQSGSALLSRFRPWQLTFVITGSLGLPVLAMMLTVREPARQECIGDGQSRLPLKAVFAYLRRHWWVYTAMLVGNAFIALANYALFAWIPAYYIRVFDYTPREIGITFGSIILVFGTAGLLLGGILADARYRRGRLGAHYNLAVGLTALGIVPAMLMLAGMGEVMQLVWVAGLVFFGSVSTALVPTATQLITPNELRGQMTAIYLLLTTLIGLGLGPTVVALLVDYHFQDTMAVGRALAMTLCGTLVIAVSIMAAGRSSYLARQHQIAEGAL